MRYALLFISFCIFQSAIAADNYPVGARSAGVANASVTYSDVWSVYHNQAGLALLKDISVGTYFENRFLISQLGLRSFTAAVPVGNVGTFGLSGTFFGYSAYSEKKAGLAYAKKLGDNVSSVARMHR